MNASRLVCPIAFLGIFVWTSAFAEDWIQIDRGEKGDLYYYDGDSVQSSGGKRLTYRGKVEFESSTSVADAVNMRRAAGLKTSGYAKLKTSFAQEEVDCRARRTRNLAGKDVDVNGNVLDEHRARGPWDEVSPGTIYARIFALICK